MNFRVGRGTYLDCRGRGRGREAGGRKARPYGYQGTSLWSEVGERARRSGTRWRHGQRRAGARPAPTATKARRCGARWGRERRGPGRGGGMGRGGRAQGPPLRLPGHVVVERGGGESAAVRDAVAA